MRKHPIRWAASGAAFLALAASLSLSKPAETRTAEAEAAAETAAADAQNAADAAEAAAAEAAAASPEAEAAANFEAEGVGAEFWKPGSTWYWIRPHTTKTTLTKLGENLYVELYCRIEPGRIRIFIIPTLKAALNLAIPWLSEVSNDIVDKAVDLVGSKGDVFCVAFKTKNLEHPRWRNLIKNPDLMMTQKAYVAGKVQTQTAESCVGRLCLVGMKVGTKDTDAMTTCVELPKESSSDGKPHSVVVGAGGGNYVTLIDQDQQGGQWPVANVGCAERKF